MFADLEPSALEMVMNGHMQHLFNGEQFVMGTYDDAVRGVVLRFVAW